MKKSLIFRVIVLIVAFIVMPQISWAQDYEGTRVRIVNGKITWKGSTIEDAYAACEAGKFVFLYNVNEDKFVTASGNYGVQGSLSQVGMRMKIHKPNPMYQSTTNPNDYGVARTMEDWPNWNFDQNQMSNPYRDHGNTYYTYYSFETRIDNKRQGDYLSPNGEGADIYLDRHYREITSGTFNSFPYWRFIAQSGDETGFTTYRIVNRNDNANFSNGPEYMGANGNSVVFVNNSSTTGLWRIVTEDDYKEAMNILEWGEIDMDAFIKDCEFIRNNKDSVYWEWASAYGALTEEAEVDGVTKTLIGDGPFFDENGRSIKNATHWHLRGQQWMDGGNTAFDINSGMGHENQGKYFVAEIYNENNSLSQKVMISDGTPLKPGLYKVTCQGFYDDGHGGNTNDGKAYFVIERNDGLTSTVSRIPLMPIAKGGFSSSSHSGIAAGKYFMENPDSYENPVFVEVKHGTTLTIRLETTSEEGWAVMDNFRFYACGVMAMYNSEDWENRIYTFQDATGHDFTGYPYDAFEYPEKYEYPATLYLQRTMTKDKWNTIILPVNIDGAKIRQSFGDDTMVSKLEKCTDTRIIFSEPVDLWTEGMQAGVPYIIKPSKDPEVPVGESVQARVGNGEAHTINIAGPAYTILGVTKTNGLPNITPIKVTSPSGTQLTMTGTFYADYADSSLGQPTLNQNFLNSYDAYIIYQGNMYHLNKPKKIFATYCYLYSPKSSSGGAKDMIFCIGDDGEATEIEGLTFMNEDMEAGFVVVSSQDVIYNINGQRVDNNNLQKGIYIKNGKKYVVR